MISETFSVAPLWKMTFAITFIFFQTTTRRRKNTSQETRQLEASPRSVASEAEACYGIVSVPCVAMGFLGFRKKEVVEVDFWKRS